MKRLRNISEEVQAQIVKDYRARAPSGNYRFSLEDVAKNYGISEGTVHDLARQAKTKAREEAERTGQNVDNDDMKRLRDISKQVQAQIIEDYQERLPSGNYRLRLEDIAKKHEICLSTVNNLAAQAKAKADEEAKRNGKVSTWKPRPRGRKLELPDARTLKLLRDATEPYISYAEVGRRNARWVTDPGTGKRVRKPLTKQRVKQIIDFWKAKGNPGVRNRGFKPGSKIRWNDRIFTVLRYDNSRSGAVREDRDGKKTDPFLWNYLGERAVLLPPEEQPSDVAKT
jgi:transposase-like protein